MKAANQPQNFSLLGFSTGWGNIGTRRVLGGQLFVAADGIKLIGMGQSWSLPREQLTITCTGFVMQAAIDKQSFHIVSAQLPAIQAALAGQGYSVKPGNAATQIAFVIILAMLIWFTGQVIASLLWL